MSKCARPFTYEITCVLIGISEAFNVDFLDMEKHKLTSVVLLLTNLQQMDWAWPKKGHHILSQSYRHYTSCPYLWGKTAFKVT